MGRVDVARARRDRLLALDLALAILGALVASLALGTPANAYVDPSVVTYTIQAIAGVAVALGAVLGVAFRRTRRAIYRLLRIDPNANKTVDPEVHFLKGESGGDGEVAGGSRAGGTGDAPDGRSGRGIGRVAARSGASATVTREEADERARALLFEASHGRPPKRLVWPIRLLLALIASTFTISTICVFTPLELVAASSESLMFGFFDVTDLVIGSGVTLALAVAFAVSPLRGTAFDVVLSILVGIGLGAFLQALFLNTSLPSADGSDLILAEHVDITVIDTIVWAALLVALIVFTVRKRQVMRVFLPFVCVLLLFVQIVSMAGIAEGERLELASLDDPLVMTTDGLNEVGAEGTVTVFVLDTFDTAYLDEILATDPAALDEFTGFTWFHNSAAAMIPTRFAVPYLLTNDLPEPGETFDDYIATRYADSRFLADIADAGYELAIFTDTLDMEAVEPYAVNIHPTHHREFEEGRLWTELEKMALVRESPWLLKPLFWFYTGDLNVNSNDAYTPDNVTYYGNIHENGLTFSDTASKTFRFIHTSGTHWPYSMDEHGNRVDAERTSLVQQGTAVLDYVEAYLRELKRLGIYDRSTVIVTADHGVWDAGVKLMEQASSPIMLAKPAETPEEAAEPLKVSYAPMGHTEYAATVMEAVRGDAGDYGWTVFQMPDWPRDRYFWYLVHDGHTDFELIQYLIQGDAVNLDDWHVTGDVIEINPGGLTDPTMGYQQAIDAGLVDPSAGEGMAADAGEVGDAVDQGTPDDGWQGY